MDSGRTVVFGVIENDAMYLEYLTDLLYGLPWTKEVIEFESAEKALHYFSSEKRKTKINFLIVDYRLSKMDGIHFLGMNEIKRAKIPKLILTGFDAEQKIFEALKYGATGYLFKEEISSLKSTIETMIKGGAHIAPTIAIRVANYFQDLAQSQEKMKKLSKKEQKILENMSEGHTAKDLSKTMNISVSTVRTHIRNIYKKLEINNKMQLIKYLNRNP